MNAGNIGMIKSSSHSCDIQHQNDNLSCFLTMSVVFIFAFQMPHYLLNYKMLLENKKPKCSVQALFFKHFFFNPFDFSSC